MKKVIFIVGLLLCLFPVISGISERRHQKNAVATYQQAVADSGETELEAWLLEAEHYNDMLYQTQGAIVGNLREDVLSDESYGGTLGLAEQEIIGNIEIPKIQVNLPIYHGTEEAVLASGIGHLQGSSLPVGGENTHSILTGHRGLPNSKLFTRLDELENEDLFYLRVCGKTLAYKINKIEVILPEDLRVLQIEPQKDLVSLVTCTPYGLNTHRLVVTGERVEYQEKEYLSCKAKMLSWRELFFLALPFLFIFAAVIRWIKDRRRGRWNRKRRV